MKRIWTDSKNNIIASIIIGVFVFLCAFYADYETAVAAKEYTISGQVSQKLYESASENSKVVANVIPENTFTILETVKDSQGKSWHHVALGGTSGYILASRVIEVEEATEETAEEAPVEESTQEDENQDASDEEVEETQQEDTATEQEEASQEEENQEVTEDTADSEGEILTDTYVTMLNNTNLRKEPSLEGEILIVVPRGIEAQAKEKAVNENYEWYKITYLTQTGYIRSDAVDVVEIVDEDENTEEDSADDENESKENVSESSYPTTVRRVVATADSSTVSYAESYERRHKWDDPEFVVSDDNNKVKKRFIDIYVVIYVLIGAIFAALGGWYISSIMHRIKNISRQRIKNNSRAEKIND